MKKPSRLPGILWVAMLAWSGASADRGDTFLSGAAVVAVSSEEPAQGAEAGLQFGINDRTDFKISGSWAATPGSFKSGAEKEGTRDSRLLLASFFTPYFGEIRPRIGGSFGMAHITDGDGINEVGFNAGLHLQALFDASDAVRVFAETHPNLIFGEAGGFSTLFKVGFEFRLSK